MVVASHLRPGMVIRFEEHLWKIVSVEQRAGQGKMGGVAHAQLLNLDTGTSKEYGFRADVKLEDTPLEKAPMDFLYRDGGNCVFMNPETFEQTEIPAAVIGPQAKLLVEQMRVTVEFVEERPVSVSFPDSIELRVVDTTPPIHGQQDNTRKQAALENGLVIQAPQFIKNGDVIRLDVANLEYMERVRK